MTDRDMLFKALADERRIKIAAAIMDRGRSLEEIAEAARLSESMAAKHLGMLRHVGLAEAIPHDDSVVYRFRQQPLHDALRSMADRPKGDEVGGDLDAFEQKVLSTFLVDGRLTSIPAQQKKRDVILRFLADRFETERMYSEKEVNAILAQFHDDVASLRRYLVDSALLRRQIVRVVDAEALMQGAPTVHHQNTYWKPSPDDPGAAAERS